MAKLIIGKAAPTSFPLKVEIQTPNGVDEVNFTALHMRATEFCKLREAYMTQIEDAVKALFDAARKDAEDAYAADTKKVKKAKPEDAEAAAQEKEVAILALQKNVKESEIISLRARHNATFMFKVLAGWDLDDAFSEEALCDMCELYPAAAQAVITAHFETREGLRTKN